MRIKADRTSARARKLWMRLEKLEKKLEIERRKLIKRDEKYWVHKLKVS